MHSDDQARAAASQQPQPQPRQPLPQQPRQQQPYPQPLPRPLRLTKREQAFTRMLTKASNASDLLPAARRAAEDALSVWQQGHDYARTLFTQVADADARLALIRWELIDRLSRRGGADALPHSALLDLGNASPEGLCMGVWAALRAVDVEDGQEREPSAPRHGCSERSERMGGWAAAAMALARPGTEARSLRAVHSPADVSLELGVNGASPSVALLWCGPEGAMTETRTVDVATWRALHALVGGLRAVDRMDLAPERAEDARRAFAAHLAGLVAGFMTPKQAVDGAVACLRPEGPRHGAGRRGRVWEWPDVFVVVVAALERFAGPGGGRPTVSPQPGTWVEVVAHGRRGISGFGFVLDPSEAPARRRFLWWRPAPIDPAVTAVVSIDGRPALVPVAHLRLPGRVALFG